MPLTNEDKAQEAVGTARVLEILTTGGWIKMSFTDSVKFTWALRFVKDAVEHGVGGTVYIGPYILRKESIIGYRKPKGY